MTFEQLSKARLRRRWTRLLDARFYEAYVHVDLFDQLCLIQTWGSLNSQRHGFKTVICQTEQDGIALLEKIHKRRTGRGYVEIQLFAQNEDLLGTEQQLRPHQGPGGPGIDLLQEHRP